MGISDEAFNKHYDKVRRQMEKEARDGLRKYDRIRFYWSLPSFLLFLSQSILDFSRWWLILGLGLYIIVFYFDYKHKLKSCTPSPGYNSGLTSQAMQHNSDVAKVGLIFFAKLLVLGILILLAFFISIENGSTYSGILAFLSGYFSFNYFSDKWENGFHLYDKLYMFDKLKQIWQKDASR